MKDSKRASRGLKVLSRQSLEHALRRKLLKVDKSILSDPLDDQEIRDILGGVPVLKYSELSKYSSIDQLLPENKSMIIILYQWGENIGHWVCVCKFNNQIIYYDSYGGKPDEPLSWNSKSINNELGQNYQYLKKLFDLCVNEVIYNPIQYQKLSNDLATCGRHCCIWLLLMSNFNMGLHQYYEFMNQMKKSLNMDYDNIVSYLIDNQT